MVAYLLDFPVKSTERNNRKLDANVSILPISAENPTGDVVAISSLEMRSV